MLSANDTFQRELMQYVPQPGMAELYKIMLTHAYNNQTGFLVSDKRNLMDQLDKINQRLKNAREIRADKELDVDDFRTLKKQCEEQANVVEMKLMELGQKERGIDHLIEIGIQKLLLLPTFYEKATSSERREIIGSMFPEKWVFDGSEHRTGRLNNFVSCIYMADKEISQKIKETNALKCDLSPTEVPSGFEPLYELLQSSA